jgi:cyclopropane-fatty-acyl-phospholipid synthase
MTATVSPLFVSSQPAADERWPDIVTVPRKPINAAIAARLVRSVARRLPLRIELPDGSPLVPAQPSDERVPVLRLNRPDAFYRRVGAGGLIGFGEAYQAGDWDADDLTAVIEVFAQAPDRIVPKQLQWVRHVYNARHPQAERNTVDGSRRNIHRHYDLSNDLFGLFLDESMTYSSALFADGTGDAAGWPDLVPAQHRKIDRLLDRIGVHDGTRLLEVGTGWGELAIRAAMRGASVHTVTISEEQHALAQRRAIQAGVADRVTVELRDYRELRPERQYDAIASVEMIEAVGEKYWPDYFTTLDRLLGTGGRIGIQAIMMAHDRMRATRHTYTWIHKYIFPGGLIPSVEAIRATLAAHTSLHLSEEFTFGRHYAATLRLWRERFSAQAERVAELGFDHVFRRTWDLYLAYSEAGFRTGYLDVAHLVMERP